VNIFLKNQFCRREPTLKRNGITYPLFTLYSAIQLVNAETCRKAKKFRSVQFGTIEHGRNVSLPNSNSFRRKGHPFLNHIRPESLNEEETFCRGNVLYL